jgi:hypothetical protein
MLGPPDVLAVLGAVIGRHYPFPELPAARRTVLANTGTVPYHYADGTTTYREDQALIRGREITWRT